jgi:hypothetical protein
MEVNKMRIPRSAPVVFIGFILFVLLFGDVFKAEAVESNLFGKPLSYTGYIKQEAGMNVFRGKTNLQSAYSSLWFETDYRLSDILDFHAVVNPTFDNAYDINSGKNWWSSAEPYYYPAGPFKKSSFGDPYNYKSGYSFSRDDMAFYDDYLLKELYVDVKLGDMVFRLGRQTVGWGESDGIRIMDFVNPLDLSREFVLRDPGFEETRIPLWMLKTSYYPGWGLGGLKISGIDFLAIPDIETTRLGMRTDGPVRGLTENGVWGLPQPILPGFITEVPFVLKERDTWDDTEFAMRIVAEAGDWLMTVNGFYGWADDFLGKATGVGALVNIPGVGLTEVGRFTPQQVQALGLNDATVHYLEANGTAGTPFAGVDQLRAYFDGVYKRQKIVGMTASRQLGFLTYANTSPIFRFEGLYEFDKSFNTDGDKWGDLAWLKPNGIVEKDQIRYMLGLDWPIRIPLLNSRQTFFTSTQFVQYIIPDYDKKLFHAPYYYGDVNKATNVTERDPYEIPKTENFFTFLINTGYDNDRIKPQVLYARDFQSKSYFVHAKIDLNYDQHWRQEIGVHIYGGDNQFHGFGLYEKEDQVYFRLRYQF